MFGHVRAQCESHGGWLEYLRRAGEERGQEGCGLLQRVLFLSARWLLAWRPGQRLPDHRTSPGHPTLASPPRCGALVLGLFVGGQEGGITPGMIPYYWACLPFRLGLLLLAGSGFILLPVLPPQSWSLWCPHTLTTTSQLFACRNRMYCVGFGVRNNESVQGKILDIQYGMTRFVRKKCMISCIVLKKKGWASII